jgi:hypothetical protein
MTEILWSALGVSYNPGQWIAIKLQLNTGKERLDRRDER